MPAGFVVLRGRRVGHTAYRDGWVTRVHALACMQNLEKDPPRTAQLVERCFISQEVLRSIFDMGYFWLSPRFIKEPYWGRLPLASDHLP